MKLTKKLSILFAIAHFSVASAELIYSQPAMPTTLPSSGYQLNTYTQPQLGNGVRTYGTDNLGNNFIIDTQPNIGGGYRSSISIQPPIGSSLPVQPPSNSLFQVKPINPIFQK